MGITKTEFYTNEQNQLAILLKALAHPARLAIIDHILKVNSCICNDLVIEIQLAQPTISQHLKELKNAGLIKGNVEGVSICYCIDEKVFEKVHNYFYGIRNILENRNNQCC
jgi:DNA-binding transcriptional ArsR family regulator